MRTILLLLLTLSFSSATHSQQLTLEGSLTGIKDGSYVYLDRSRSYLDMHLVKDSARMRSGHFRFQLTIPPGQGEVYYFSTLPIVYYENSPVISGPHFGRTVWLYLEAGHMTITGDAALLDLAVLDGDPLAKEEEDYFIRRRKNKWWGKFVKDYDDAVSQRTLPGFSEQKIDSLFFLKAMTGLLIYENIARSWVEQHPGSSFCPAVMLHDLKPWLEGSDGRDTLYKKLTPSAKNSQSARVLAGILRLN